MVMFNHRKCFAKVGLVDCVCVKERQRQRHRKERQVEAVREVIPNKKHSSSLNPLQN